MILKHLYPARFLESQLLLDNSRPHAPLWLDDRDTLTGQSPLWLENCPLWLESLYLSHSLISFCPAGRDWLTGQSPLRLEKCSLWLESLGSLCLGYFLVFHGPVSWFSGKVYWQGNVSFNREHSLGLECFYPANIHPQVLNRTVMSASFITASRPEDKVVILAIFSLLTGIPMR